MFRNRNNRRKKYCTRCVIKCIRFRNSHDKNDFVCEENIYRTAQCDMCVYMVTKYILKNDFGNVRNFALTLLQVWFCTKIDSGSLSLQLVWFSIKIDSGSIIDFDALALLYVMFRSKIDFDALAPLLVRSSIEIDYDAFALLCVRFSSKHVFDTLALLRMYKSEKIEKHISQCTW